jgi:hypothetical protein
VGKNDNIQEEIAKEAYSLYLNRGMADGHDVHDWIRAEQIVFLKRSLPGDRSSEGPASSRNINIKKQQPRKNSG